MTEEEQHHALNAAHIAALAELVRIAIGELAFAGTRAQFKLNLSMMERAAIAALKSRPPAEEMSEETAAFVKAAAGGYVSRLIGSIPHPDDPKAN